MRGFGVFSIILFISGFIALLVAVFIIINSENMSGKKAQQTADKIILDLATVVADNNAIKEALEKYNTANDKDYHTVMEALAKNTIENDKLNQKIQWLELKTSTVPPKNNLPTKIILTQEAPLKVSMIYKKLDMKKKPVQNKELTREELLIKAKRQVQELSK